MKWKRIIVIIMVCLMISSTTVEARAAAEAGALSVLGGSVAAGGIGAAIAAIAPPAIIIVGIALAAQGIYVAISEESEKMGMTKSDYIGTKLAQFALESGKQYSDVCHDIVDGSSVTETGSIALTTSASKTIYQFINSLVANDEIVNAPTTTGEYVVIGNVNVPVVKNGESLNYADSDTFINEGASEVLIFYSDYVVNTKRAFAFTLGNRFRYRLNQGNIRDTVGNGFGHGRYIELTQIYNNSVLHVPYIKNWESVFQNLESLDIQGGGLTEDSFVGDVVDTSILNPNAGDVVVLNPGMDIPAIANEYGKAGTISIDNYLESLTRALNGVEANTVTISNALTGALDTVAVGTYNPVGTATVDQVAEEDLPRVLTPVIDISLNPSGSAAENSLKGLQFDLTAIFPFCIPFDIVALIQKFDVQPETPAISVSLPLPGVNTTLDLDLDLAPFETVARILRTMELIAFIFGLMMVTRHLIRG